MKGEKKREKGGGEREKGGKEDHIIWFFAWAEILHKNSELYSHI